MGKRKAAAKKPVGPRKNAPLPSVFPCLFCNHEKSVMVKLDKKSGYYMNLLECINNCVDRHIDIALLLNSPLFTDLSAAVDVYSDWVDACDAVAKIDGELKEQPQIATRASDEGGASTFRGISSRRNDEIHDRRNNDTRTTSGGNFTRLPATVDDDDY
ncbi:Transcription elongation factor 1-like protein [Erysiphe neolycopersici]|uniref:Transcription elongation factor 1 homolog n=1 Tax=Erysiphe neolycopersici TaxID=212602 RepID=A0A420HQ14_9PEZI|nr:Transcription elongation factor 1-like protein [Erysiphe neolycopersici]